jgi:hypothetical protein
MSVTTQAAMDAVVIDGTTAEAVSREGARASMELGELMSKLAPPPAMQTLDVVLPDGIKAARSRGRLTIWVHETPPATWNLKWIANDSKARYGPGTKYRKVRIALPYLITFCVFEQTPPDRRMLLGSRNECFFRREPLDRLDEGELCFPALLNCSKFPREEGKPLAWICTEHLDYDKLSAIDDTNDRLRASFRTLMETLLGSGFNFSSEAHEGASWFSETVRKKVDPRVAGIDQWQSETTKNPLFVLEVPWLGTGRTVEQMMERIFSLAHADNNGAVKTSADVARIIFNST